MMREILFRGKRLDNGEWVEGSGFLREGDACWIYGKIKREGDCFNDWEKVDPTTVGQFTGLCDKNGKKIFEGDIVRVCLNPEIDTGVIKFDERIAGFIIDFNPCELGTFLDMFLAFQEVGNKVWVEVIGNVHDNPELLEVDNG
jgi:uncharacterized phage protein (TIGR01671 family)